MGSSGTLPRAGEDLRRGEAERTVTFAAPLAPTVTFAAPEAPTAELVREALDETRELVRLEVALAREELTAELSRAKVAVASLAAAGALVVCGLTLVLAAIALAFTKAWLVALVLGLILTVLSCAVGLGGWKSLPRKLLGETRGRIESDLKQLKERIA
jgi:hypothetical protein